MEEKNLIGLSHQLAAQRSMEVIANNIANLSTPAFKRDVVKFEEFIRRMPPPEGETEPELISLVKDAGTVRDLAQGRLVPTGAPHDLAIAGQGYFVVQTPKGDRYTRNGHLSLDAEGRLVTDLGNPVLGEGGAIAVAFDDGDIHVAADGTISGKHGQIGKLRLVEFAKEDKLLKEGNSLYATSESPSTATSASVVQGSLESSNVEPVVEIARMIEVMRAYEMTAGLLKDEDKNTLKRLSTFNDI